MIGPDSGSSACRPSLRSALQGINEITPRVDTNHLVSLVREVPVDPHAASRPLYVVLLGLVGTSRHSQEIGGPNGRLPCNSTFPPPGQIFRQTALQPEHGSVTPDPAGGRGSHHHERHGPRTNQGIFCWPLELAVRWRGARGGGRTGSDRNQMGTSLETPPSLSPR